MSHCQGLVYDRMHVFAFILYNLHSSKKDDFSYDNTYTFLFYFEPQRNLKVALLAGIVTD